MENWSGVTFNFDNRLATKTDLQMQSLPNYDGSLDMSFNSLLSTDLAKNTFYFQSGLAYSGSQLKSYAGSITYSLTYYGATSAGMLLYTQHWILLILPTFQSLRRPPISSWKVEDMCLCSFQDKR